MAALNVIILSVVMSSVIGGIIPDHESHIEEFGALPHHHHIELPPAISTFSFISLNHHKPTSYSGFTNHGRGHHDPGYAVQFRQDGYEVPHHGHYEHSHY